MKSNNRKSLDQQKNAVRHVLRNAFSSVPFPFMDADAAHQPIVQALKAVFDEPPSQVSIGTMGKNYRQSLESAYFDLGLFDAAGFRYVLPRLLDDLLNYDPDQVRYTVLVLGYLDVPMQVITSNLGEGDIGSSYTQEQHTLFKKGQYQLFTAEQIEAILEWMIFARNWGEMQDYQEILEEAIIYWKSALASG